MNIKTPEQKERSLRLNKKIGNMLKEVRGEHSQLKVSIKISGIEGKYASREMIARYELGKNKIPLDVYRAYVKIYGETEVLHQIGLLLGYIDNPLVELKQGDKVAVKHDNTFHDGIIESVTSNQIKLKYSSLKFDRNGVSEHGDVFIMPITNDINNLLYREKLMEVVNMCQWDKMSINQLRKVVRAIVNE